MTSDETEAIAAQLAAWIWDENRVITAKILARQRPLHINAAKRHLAAFARQAQRPLDVMYGLSGRVAGHRTVAWVPHDDLARAEAAFSPLTSKYVDAVAPPGLITAHGLFTANMNEIRSQPHLNSYAAIYDRRCVPRIQSDDEPETAKPQVKAEIKTEEPVLTPVEKPPVKPATTKANRGRIAGLFAKAAVAKKAEPEVKTETNELSPGQENRLNEEKEAHTQDSAPVPSRNQKRTAQKSRPAANQPKRRRIKVMSDSDSSEAEAESEPIEIEDVPAPPQVNPLSLISNLYQTLVWQRYQTQLYLRGLDAQIRRLQLDNARLKREVAQLAQSSHHDAPLSNNRARPRKFSCFYFSATSTPK